MKRCNLVIFCALLIGCGGGGGSKGGGETIVDTPSLDQLVEDTYEMSEEQITSAKKILFADGTIDDVEKKQCTPDKVCNIALKWTEKRDLKLKVVENDKPVEGETLVFTLEGDNSKNLATLAQEMSSTNAEGIATNSITTKQQDGEFKIKVCSTNIQVPCIWYKVIVTQKGLMPLIVRFKPYTGAFPQLNHGSIRVFKKEVAKCADITVENVGQLSATTGKEISIDESAFFSEINTLLEAQPDKEFEFTIFGMGSVDNGPVLAQACDDTTAKIKYNQTVIVELNLEDLMPSIAKSFKVYNQFNLVEGLPDNVKNIVNMIIGFFTDPVGEVLLLFCKAGIAQNNDTLSSFCGYVFKDKGNPNLNEKTVIGDAVTKVLNSVVMAVIDKYCPYKDNPDLCKDVAYMGKEVSKMLTEFRVISTITIKKEPDAKGNILAENTEEVWRTVVVKWSYGQGCPPEDDACGLLNLEFTAIPGVDKVVSSKFDATITKQTKTTPATIDIHKHGLNMKYGALMNYALEKLVLPKLFGPKVDSYEKLLGSLMGGYECLQEDDCCTQFAKKVTKETSAITEKILEDACKALIDVGAQYLRDSLLKLDVDTGENFTLRTKEPCPMFDESNPPDLVIEKLGKKDKPCIWDANLKIGGESFPPQGQFYGKVE